MKNKRILTVVSITLLLLSSFLVFPVQATEISDWSKPRPFHTIQDINETVGNASTDHVASIAMGVKICDYLENYSTFGYNDVLGFRLSLSANSREWIDYDWEYPTYFYIWQQASRQTNITGDNSGTWLELGFPLLFYGVEYYRIWVCSNGFLCLDSNFTGPSPPTIPNTQEPNSFIAPFWRDLHPENGGLITYAESVEFEGDSYFVVSWNNVPDEHSNPQSFQILIQIRDGFGSSDLHNKIYFQYNTITKDITTSIGMEDQLGRRGESINLDNISNGLCRRFNVPIKGYRLQRLTFRLIKDDTEAMVFFAPGHFGGINVILNNSDNPFFDFFKIPVGVAVEFLLALCVEGAVTGFMLGSLVVVGEVISEFAAELSPPFFDTNWVAQPGDNQLYVSSECVIEGRSIMYDKPFDASLAAVVQWEFLDPNDVDHSLEVIAEATYINLFDGSLNTISTSSTLNMKTERYLNIKTRKTTGSSISGVKVWVDSTQYYSPTNITVNTAMHTIQAESSFFRNEWWLYTFDHWEDGSTNNPRTIIADDNMNITAYYTVDYLCPTLFVWNGNDFIYETLLNIHAESDITVQHQIQQTLVADGLFYKLQLRELDNFTSHIDQVKLYAVDTDGEWHVCPLALAKHNDTYVTLKLYFDDDRRVDLAPTEIINLKFLKTIPQDETAYFIFEINGHNRKIP